jgi:hypothetical protein
MVGPGYVALGRFQMGEESIAPLATASTDQPSQGRSTAS